MKSPFEFSSPEAMSAEDILDLFVPVFGEYLNVPNIGHTFINGPRGSGKSMIFRYMSPDCQVLVNKKKLEELEYFAIHIPIKEGQIDKTDLSLLSGKKEEVLLNEHFMVINFAIKIFEKLSETNFEDTNENIDALKKFFKYDLLDLLNFSGWEKHYELGDENTCNSLFLKIKRIFLEINKDFSRNFISSLFMTIGAETQYTGPIFRFLDFLLELLNSIKKLPFMPGTPIYLLIDDADNLNENQTKILNTWVSSRTSKTVSFKISTQLKYKTYKTTNNSRIDTPHDYAEINISDIYTTKKGLYQNRVKEAVERRLNKFGFVDVNAEDFFPQDKEQEEKIAKLFQKYQSKEGYDYAYRYARPDYMKRLSGNRSTYSYAGFKSLVNISSGVMRHFIDFAHKMYSHQSSRYGEKIDCINPTIQNEEVKEYSIWFFDENFTKLRGDSDNTKEEINDFDKLRNLLEALGQTFSLILFSDATERRVFSFALQDEPNEELRKILRLGVENGYFHKSLIGNKMGTGKAQLYVLNRLLAPYFKLDPTSFAGYKFVTCDILYEAMYRPNTIVGRIKTKGIDAILDNPQQSLFKDRDYDESDK